MRLQSDALYLFLISLALVLLASLISYQPGG